MGVVLLARANGPVSFVGGATGERAAETYASEIYLDLSRLTRLLVDTLYQLGRSPTVSKARPSRDKGNTIFTPLRPVRVFTPSASHVFRIYQW